MLKVGLTGGIGSGKSFIGNLFVRLGIPLYNSDERGKYLMNHSAEVKSAIISLLGYNAYEHGELNRKYIAAMVFNNPELLEKLNKIVHPAVFSDFNRWCNAEEKKNTPFVLQEAAILVESGAYKLMDKVILVTAPEELRIQRVINRDKVTAEEVTNRMKNQKAADDLIPLADFIIINDDKKLILPQIINIYNKLVKHGKIR